MERYQTFGLRFVAILIDGCVFIPIVALLYFSPSIDIPNPIRLLAEPIPPMLALAYYVGMHWKYGQTLGKMVVKIKVVDMAGGPISLRQAAARHFDQIARIVVEVFAVIYLLALGGFGSLTPAEQIFSMIQFVWFAADTVVCIRHPQKRALHDFLAGTVVVRLDVPGEEVSTVFLEPPGPDSYEDLRDLRQ